MSSTNILYLSFDGTPNLCLSEKLQRAEIAVIEVHTIQRAEEELLKRFYNVFVIRYDHVDESANKLIQFVVKHKLQVELIISVKTGFVEDAVKTIKSGASDFIVGDNADVRLIESILKAVANTRTTLEKNDNEVQNSEQNNILIGQSPSICEIRSAVALVAKSLTTVLITGESGTGKEIVARLIHRQSSRSGKQFIALNCATLPKDVIENELFGHEKGAFTGSIQKKIGCFELADGGTLLFDEIAEMSLETQAKLLRAIETQKFRRLGGREEIKVDVRMIAATNKNISDALKSKELREDLYYRLSVIEIYVPPLRERKEDVHLLIEYFLSIFSTKYDKPVQRFSDSAMEMLGTYDWPGNIRELRNIVERALVICPNEIIGHHYLPEKIQKQISTRQHINIPFGSSTQEAERIVILQTLASTGNNKSKAAKILGVSRKTLHNKLHSFQQ